MASSVTSLRLGSLHGQSIDDVTHQWNSDLEDDVVRVVLSQNQPAKTLFAKLEEKSHRRAYFDLGANWANTLRLYKDLADPHQVEQQQWEVYAFEASPLIVPYIDKFVVWLNGDGPKPELLWPPAGSTTHLQQYAKRYGCPVTPIGAMRRCMWKVFKKPLKLMVPDDSLMSADVVKSRVAQASSPPINGSNRFVLIPAAAGASENSMHLGGVAPKHMIRGGAIDNDHHGKQFDVPVADFVSMLTSNFQEEDYVVVKMDIEGGEFEILDRLIKEQHGHLIDVLALECHDHAGDCKGLLQNWTQISNAEMVQEGSGYHGWDSDSTPENYYPTDPRG
mmetsp:Transcript_60983/g.122240  ORF Transcript_60983/g.122240 Transcript_60983/m.122240 type:complete len:334 (+) Transcript_60983:2-1003(+)